MCSHLYPSSAKESSGTCPGFTYQNFNRDLQLLIWNIPSYGSQIYILCVDLFQSVSCRWVFCKALYSDVFELFCDLVFRHRVISTFLLIHSAGFWHWCFPHFLSLSNHEDQKVWLYCKCKAISVNKVIFAISLYW